MKFEMNFMPLEATPFLSFQFTTIKNINMVGVRTCEMESVLALLLAWAPEPFVVRDI
jgi:hypothetical protein